jgi:hypothetical protein
MAFDIFTAKRVSCFGQYDRIDDLITRKLRGDKRTVHRQFLVDEFHPSPVCKCFDPLVVWHLAPPVRGQRLTEIYFVRCEKFRSGITKFSFSEPDFPDQLTR